MAHFETLLASEGVFCVCFFFRRNLTRSLGVGEISLYVHKLLFLLQANSEAHLSPPVESLNQFTNGHFPTLLIALKIYTHYIAVENFILRQHHSEQKGKKKNHLQLPFTAENHTTNEEYTKNALFLLSDSANYSSLPTGLITTGHAKNRGKCARVGKSGRSRTDTSPAKFTNTNRLISLIRSFFSTRARTHALGSCKHSRSWILSYFKFALVFSGRSRYPA